MPLKTKGIRLELAVKGVASKHWVVFIWVISFCAGMFFGNRMWMVPQAKQTRESHLVYEDFNSKVVARDESMNNSENGLKTYQDLKDIKHRMKYLEETSESTKMNSGRRKYVMVVGINTSFNSTLRRASLRKTWVPKGEKRRKLEEEKGIIIRFVIGHSSEPGSVLEKVIEEEEKKYGDFLRLDHVEGYHELSAKTKTYFSTAFTLWDADYYVKIDDDVHLNLATLAKILLSHNNKPRVYIGCMKTGPVLHQKKEKYHEPEYLKFGNKGNNYFRHATGQIYAISKDLASYIATNKNILHKYANEDVSLGTWFIGLNIEQISDRRFCCGSTNECELRGVVGRTCAATFEWRCSGICDSVNRIKEIHQRCKEDEDDLWHTY